MTKSAVLSSLLLGLPFTQGLVQLGDMCLDIPLNSEGELACGRVGVAECDPESASQDFFFSDGQIRHGAYQGAEIQPNGANTKYKECGQPFTGENEACVGRLANDGPVALGKCNSGGNWRYGWSLVDGNLSQRLNKGGNLCLDVVEGELTLGSCDLEEVTNSWVASSEAGGVAPEAPPAPVEDEKEEDGDMDGDMGGDEEEEGMVEEVEMMDDGMKNMTASNMTMTADAMDMDDMEEDMEAMKEEMEADMADMDGEEDVDVATEKAGGERALRGKVLSLVNAMK